MSGTTVSNQDAGAGVFTVGAGGLSLDRAFARKVPPLAEQGSVDSVTETMRRLVAARAFRVLLVSDSYLPVLGALKSKRNELLRP